MRDIVMERLPLFIYLVFAFLIMQPYLGPGYFLALDMQWGPNTFADFQFEDLYGTEGNPYGAYLPFRLVFAALSAILSVGIVEKLLLLFILFLAGASAHHSLPKELGHARYFAGIFYMLNPFVFVRFLAGHWAILLSYALWPLAIAFFWEFLKKPRDRDTLIRVVLITSLASVSSHSVAILLIAYLIIFITHIALKSRSPKVLIQRTALAALMVLVLNLFWIAPTLLLFESEYSLASPEAYLEDFGAWSSDMPLGIALFTLHGFWRGGFIYPEEQLEWLYLPFTIVILLAFLGTYHLLKKRTAFGLSLVFIFIIAFLLALGASGPISWVFEIFGERIPLYFLFRDTQKFVGLLALSYSLAGAYGMHHLAKMFRSKYVIILLLVPVISNIGFFFYQTQVGVTEYPEGWAEADRIIAEDDTPSNILVFSLYHYRPYGWLNSMQKTLGNLASQFFSKPVITSANTITRNVYSDKNDPHGRLISGMFEYREYIDNTAELLLPLNARYIIVFKEEPDSPHFLYLFHRVGGVKDIEMVYESPELYLFRNNLVKGPFMASMENGSLGQLIQLEGKGLYSPDVQYEKLGHSRYRIIDSPHRYIVFAHPFNSFWEYDSGETYPWHGIATGFKFSEGGILENKLFYLVPALLLLSWLIVLLMLLEPSVKPALGIIGAFVVLYALFGVGAVGPPLIGALLLISFIITSIWCLTKK